MPRFSEDTQSDIYEGIAPESALVDKVRASWVGLQKVEVYRFEKDPKTKKMKEELLGTIYPLGDPDDDMLLPDPGCEPIDDVNELIRWVYSLGITDADDKERRVGCRCRLFGRPKPDMEADKISYAKFEAVPLDEEEEDEDEDEPEGDPRHPSRRFPMGPPDPRDPRMGGRLGMGMFDQQQRLLREREERTNEQERQARGDAMEYLRDRTAKIEERETGLIVAYQDVIKDQQTQIRQLTGTQNSMVDATIGGRRAELEARRESNAALTSGIQMQFEVLRQRSEMIEAGAESRVTEAKKGSQHRLWEALLVPVVASLPTLFTSFAQMWQAGKGGEQIPAQPQVHPQTHPQTHPQAQPHPQSPARPRPQPRAAPMYQQPQAQPQPASESPAAESPLATGKPFAGCFITCNEVQASLTDEQKIQLAEKLGDDTHKALLGWLGATTDTECVAGLVMFQQLGGTDAYKILDEVMEEGQEEKLLKVINQIQADQPDAPKSGSVIDIHAKSGPPPAS